MEFLSFAIIIGSLALGTISPGPSFILVARVALGKSRNGGIAASLGMAIGACFFATLSLVGLQIIFNAVPFLYFSLKIMGGLYLLYMAWMTWKGRNDPGLSSEDQDFPNQKKDLFISFRNGLITQVSNPKTAIVYTSIFASLMPKNYTFQDTMILVSCIFLLEAGWYSFVSIILSHPIPKRIYLNAKRTIDKITTGILVALGLKIILSE